MPQLYRPSLTIDQIDYLISLCKKEQSNVLAFSTLQKLQKFKLKAAVGLVSASHSSESLEEKLGISPPISMRVAAYEKYKISPNICTELEVLEAKTYMYEHDLLTPDEETQFEIESGLR